MTPENEINAATDEVEEKDLQTLDLFGAVEAEERAFIEPELPAIPPPQAAEGPAQISFADEWWKEHWDGMPAYNNADLTPWKSMMVHFGSPEAFADFQRVVGQRFTEKTKMCWHPAAEIGRFADKRWVDAQWNARVLRAKEKRPDDP